jgi:hypothetical protein
VATAVPTKSKREATIATVKNAHGPSRRESKRLKQTQLYERCHKNNKVVSACVRSGVSVLQVYGDPMIVGAAGRKKRGM